SVGLIGINSAIKISVAHVAANGCTWTPSDPAVGDLIEIVYDPSIGTIDASVEAIDMHWYMVVKGGKFPKTVPSQSMWPEGTTAGTNEQINWGGPDQAITPMVRQTDGSWKVNFTLSDVPDELVIWFKSGSTKDDNSGGNWIIESPLKTARIFPVSPAFNNPVFATPGGSAELIVNASDSATDWAVYATGKSDTPIPLSPSASYDATKGQWKISVSIPSTMTLGLYDLQFDATINEGTSTKIEYHSLSVINETKDDYWFIVISDPQHFRDGSYSGGKDDLTGDGNVTEVFEMLNLLDPEFIIMTGDVTEWTDEVAMQNQKKWILEYLQVPIFILPGNHDEFEKTGSTGNHEYGSGKGVFQRIYGPMHWTFMYGDHYFASGFSDDQHIQNVLGEEAWIKDVITNTPSSASMKTFTTHHPLDGRYYGTTEEIDIASDIKSWLNTGKFDYYLHGHMHGDYYSELSGTTHIGTDNCVGSVNTSSEIPGYATGIRLIHVQDDEFTKFSYDTPDSSAYTAESNPLYDITGTIPMVSVSFSQDNDGSSTSNTATFSYKYNHTYEGARVRFAMKPSSKCYQVTGGDIKAEYLFENTYYIDVKFDVLAASSTTISVNEIECPTETPANTSTDTTDTDDGGAPGFELIIAFNTVVAIAIIRRKRQN
ncbi:MAG: metallophosphoesterase family protein, partial [Candidatus Kariarchaeaceae archaeon]